MEDYKSKIDLTKLTVNTGLGLVLVLGIAGCGGNSRHSLRPHPQERYVQRYQETRHQQPQRRREYRQPMRRIPAPRRDMQPRPYMRQLQRQPMRGMSMRGQYMQKNPWEKQYMQKHQEQRNRKHHSNKRTR